MSSRGGTGTGHRSPRTRSLKSKITAGIRGFTGGGSSSASGGGLSKSESSTVVQRPHRQQGVTANQQIMPYLIIVQDGSTIELKGSADGMASSHLFSKFGMDQLISTKGKSDLKNVKLDYFSLLERGGFCLISSSACSAEGRIVREYLFRRNIAMKRTSLADIENPPGTESRNSIWKLRHSSCDETIPSCASSRCHSPDDELFRRNQSLDSPRCSSSGICTPSQSDPGFDHLQVSYVGTPAPDNPAEQS